MAVELWVEVVCARCASNGPGQHVTGQRVPRKELMYQARLSGWQFKDDEAFCGKRCLREAGHE